VVAEDTTENLARGGADTGRFILTVKGTAAETAAVLASIGGIQRVHPMDNAQQLATGQASFLVECAKDASVRVPLFHALAAKAIPIIELRTVGVTLEEAFLQLTGDDEEPQG
jgi:ABC-2 type transport system ATP-binding protein